MRRWRNGARHHYRAHISRKPIADMGPSGPFFAVKKKPAINAGLNNKLRAYQRLEIILKARTKYSTFVNEPEVGTGQYGNVNTLSKYFLVEDITPIGHHFPTLTAQT